MDEIQVENPSVTLDYQLSWEKAKEDLETYFNALELKIQTAINTDNSSKDW